MRSPAGVFSIIGDRSRAVRLDTLSSNRYFQQAWGRQLDDLRKIKEFQQTARHTHIACKGVSTMASVKAWVKRNKPLQFFASWTSDSRWYKDDCVEIWFTTEDPQQLVTA